jgi:protein TonB
MAVQILNDMPDAAVNRGDPFGALRELAPQRAVRAWHSRFRGRAGFAIATVSLHLIAFAALVNVQSHDRATPNAEPIIVSFVDAPPAPTERPADYTPPLQDITYALPVPQEVSFESDAITLPEISTAISEPSPQTVAPVVVDSVEYVRPPAPVYPSESNYRRERGTVVLRVMIDTLGRPAQIQIERSSGFARLDSAARAAVEKALFRPYEVNGIAQPAQVFIPIEFKRRAT